MQIDFHAHILPGCDHGSDRRRTSLKQLSLAREAGVELICATPHFYPQRDDMDEFLERRAYCAKRLFDAMEETGEEYPRILVGAEVLLCDNLNRLDRLEKLCLEGTNILLLELPYTGFSDEMYETIEALKNSRKYNIIFAHVDRYDRAQIEQILRMGFPAQINVDSLCKTFVPSSIKRWVKYGAAIAYGSDIHGTDEGYINWNKARKRMGDNWDKVMSETEKFIFQTAKK